MLRLLYPGSNRRVEKLDKSVKGLMLWVMCSETGKKGKPVNVIQTVLQFKPGVGYVVLQEVVGLCLLLPAGNKISAAMELQGLLN